METIFQLSELAMSNNEVIKSLSTSPFGKDVDELIYSYMPTTYRLSEIRRFYFREMPGLKRDIKKVGLRKFIYSFFDDDWMPFYMYEMYFKEVEQVRQEYQLENRDASIIEYHRKLDEWSKYHECKCESGCDDCNY